MSRQGTPTDNPKMESINGWIKDEIINDWDIDSYDSFDEFINVQLVNVKINTNNNFLFIDEATYFNTR